MDNVLELLLNTELQPPKVELVKVPRLSKLCDGEVCFKIKQLTYNQVHKLREDNESPQSDMTMAIVLAGVVEPDLKNKELLEKYSAPTPAELVSRMLSAGEVEDLAAAIERISGYRGNTMELVGEIKKK